MERAQREEIEAMSAQSRSRTAFAIVLGLMVVFSIILAVAAWRIQAVTQRPAPEGTHIQLSPASGGPNTMISVTGGGWQRGETVRLTLVDADTGATDGLIYARAAASRQGRIATSFRYPMAGPWADKDRAIVLARGGTSGEEASGWARNRDAHPGDRHLRAQHTNIGAVYRDA
jgi:hypothetical protein